jgi:hypothetical protein
MVQVICEIRDATNVDLGNWWALEFWNYRIGKPKLKPISGGQKASAASRSSCSYNQGARRTTKRSGCFKFSQQQSFIAWKAV